MRGWLLLAAITEQPRDANVIAGIGAGFSVQASGGTLRYQWQRSSDGGASFQNVAGQGASISVAATTLADNGSLWRVIVSNDSGSVTSTLARLSVTAAATPPAIVSDPADQSVLVGQVDNGAATGAKRAGRSIGLFSVAAEGTSPKGERASRPTCC